MVSRKNSQNSEENQASGGVSADRLRSFVERVERLEEEKRALSADIKEVYAEAKGNGFDTKIIRLIVKERARDQDDLFEERALLDTYRKALGMIADLPLGNAALGRLRKDFRAGKIDLKVGEEPWLSEQVAEREARA